MVASNEIEAVVVGDSTKVGKYKLVPGPPVFLRLHLKFVEPIFQVTLLCAVWKYENGAFCCSGTKMETEACSYRRYTERSHVNNCRVLRLLLTSFAPPRRLLVRFG